MTNPIPLHWQEPDPDVLDDLRAVLQSGWLTQGEQTEAFEGEFAHLHGVGGAVALSNCTAALHLALVLAGIGPGDDVLVPSLTFVATANAVRYVGARPVFVDIGSLEEPLVCVRTLEAALTPQTKALVVVHYAGYACNMEAIGRFAACWGLCVVEDAAHGPARDERGRWLGTYGDYGCFSFYGNKVVSCGEGGMLLCRDPEQLARARLMRSHGMTQSALSRQRGQAATYDVVTIGYNYRFDDLRAVVARRQLASLEARCVLRKQAVDHYRRYLSQRPELGIPFRNHDSGSYHIMPVLLAEGQSQAEAMRRMKEAGVFTSLHYPPVHRLSDFAFARGCELPVTDAYCRRTITLPLYPALRDEQIRRVVDSIP